MSFDSVHDQWLYHLRSSDGKIAGDAEELTQLVTQVQEWQRPIAITAVTPFRLCFRLEEPQAIETEIEQSSFASTPNSRL